MRDFPVLRSLWESSGGNFLGDNKADGRVTVEPAWQLNLTGTTYGTLDKGPYRYWFYADQSQTEVEVPNVKSIKISRSIDQDAGTCNITLYNQWMDNTGTTPPSPDQLGNPGYLWFDYGSSPEIQALYGTTANTWADVLVPNALLRTYQGYGSYTDGVPDDLSTAETAGNLVITGTWLIDQVSTGTDGLIQIRCRDMAKLLIDQKIFPPFSPERVPLKYCRFVYEYIPFQEGDPGQAAIPAPPVNSGPVGVSFRDCTTLRWYPGTTTLHGHRHDAVADGDDTTSSYSVGVVSPNRIFARAWWEVDVNAEINEVYINYANNSAGTVWISIMVDGSWVGANDIPWDNDGNGRSASLCAVQTCVVEDVDIPYVIRTSVGNRGVWIPLPSYSYAQVTPEPGGSTVTTNTYNVQRIRVTTNQSWYSGIGPWYYRAVLQEINGRLVREADDDEGTPAIPATPDTPAQTIEHPGNITDYTEIVKDLLLWAGFLYYEGGSPAGGGQVHGILQFSGAYPVECINEDFFDKKSVIEPIRGIRDTLGYLFFIDEEGAVRFHTPNWWSSGNTLESGTRTTYIPELWDQTVLTKYTTTVTDASMRSEIIVGSLLPTETDDDTTHVSLVPDNRGWLRGMVKPAAWINEVFQDQEEQLYTAAIISLHAFFQSRKGNVTALCNPEIQINDQVRITERVSGDSYIHYVRALTTNMDLDTGEYTMTLTTNWLGEEDEWAFDREYFLSQWGELIAPDRDAIYDTGADAFRAPGDPIRATEDTGVGDGAGSG